MISQRLFFLCTILKLKFACILFDSFYTDSETPLRALQLGEHLQVNAHIHTYIHRKKVSKRKKYDKNHPVCLYQVHWWISSAVEAAVVAGPVHSVRQLSALGPRPAVSGPAQWPGCCRAAQVQRRLSAWSSGLWGLRYWWWEHWAGPHQLRTWGSGGQYWGSSAWLLTERKSSLKHSNTIKLNILYHLALLPH